MSNHKKSATKEAPVQVLHTLADLANTEVARVDITGAVSNLTLQFSGETEAIDKAIAHTQEAIRLENLAQEGNRVLKELRQRRDRLQGIIDSAEKVVQKAFDDDPIIKKQKMWMMAHNRSDEYMEALAAQKEIIVQEMVSKEIEALGIVTDEITSVFADVKVWDEAAGKEYAVANQIKLEAGFQVK